jgi:hypothetical protein
LEALKMAKGHMRSNREIRKPKKEPVQKRADPAILSVTSAFARPSKMPAKPSKR